MKNVLFLIITQWKYLSLHILGLVFSIFSIFGIAGDTRHSALAKLATKCAEVFLNLGMIGIPLLILGSVLLFAFEKTALGQYLSYVSLVVGVGSIVWIFTVHRIKQRVKKDKHS